MKNTCVYIFIIQYNESLFKIKNMHNVSLPSNKTSIKELKLCFFSMLKTYDLLTNKSNKNFFNIVDSELAHPVFFSTFLGIPGKLK